MYDTEWLPYIFLFPFNLVEKNLLKGKFKLSQKWHRPLRKRTTALADWPLTHTAGASLLLTHVITWTILTNMSRASYSRHAWTWHIMEDINILISYMLAEKHTFCTLLDGMAIWQESRYVFIGHLYVVILCFSLYGNLISRDMPRYAHYESFSFWSSRIIDLLSLGDLFAIRDHVIFFTELFFCSSKKYSLIYTWLFEI